MAWWEGCGVGGTLVPCVLLLGKQAQSNYVNVPGSPGKAGGLRSCGVRASALLCEDVVGCPSPAGGKWGPGWGSARVEGCYGGCSLSPGSHR